MIDRLFTYARNAMLSTGQFAAISRKVRNLPQRTSPRFWPRSPHELTQRLRAWRDRCHDTERVSRRGTGAAPSTVIGCLVHGAEHAMRHVGQLSVTVRIVRSGMREA